MKVVFVTPRYGLDVVGGAETGARRVAENLSNRPDWDVEVITTCALDERAYVDSYPVGEEQINGVRVRRFHVERGRSLEFAALSDQIFSDLDKVTEHDERLWLEQQGPVSAGLLEAIRSTDADVVVFTPYLFHPTVCGVPLVPTRSVLVPAAHDEGPIRLPMYQELFSGAAGLIFHTDSERKFVETQFPVASHRQAVIGLGCDPSSGTEADATREIGLGDRPFVLCLGRVDHGKGSSYLASFFAAYKERRPGPLALVFAGPVSDEPPPHADIIVTGRIDDETKWGLLRGALALISPSAYESFSIVLLEAWAAGTPVFVNGRCAVTREQCERSAGGLWFDRFVSFTAGLERLVSDSNLRSSLAAGGHAYWKENYRWETVADRYASFLEGVSHASKRAGSLSSEPPVNP